MDTKLTLKLNANVIEQAKQYAKQNNISLSKMIENYLQAVTSNENREIVFLDSLLIFSVLIFYNQKKK